MKMSRFYCPTLKETPAEAETISHKLMLRAGMIRKVSAGIYSYLPLGYSVVKKVETIIREELDRVGCQEVHLPILHPAELWKESGRWDDYGDDLMKVTDRKDREYCLGPTHEEVITDMIRNELRSYKSLPVNLYQIQTKVRDEIRPRFGVMRSKEFSMKDAYSFHGTEDCMAQGYQTMYQAYSAIFSRCGLKFKIVEADSGAIGGSQSHEFMVLAQTGEDEILECKACSYAANVERARSRVLEKKNEGVGVPSKETVHTPGVKTIDELKEFLAIGAENIIKTLVFKGNVGVVYVLLKGDDEVNPARVRAAIGDPSLELYEGELENIPLGYVGPIGAPQDIKILADQGVMDMSWGVVGANQEGYHIKGVKAGEDFQPLMIDSFRLSRPQEGCPQCADGILQSIRGIEVGHIFNLGTKYSQSMQATFLDQNGKEQPFIMGCYGIGVTRTVAAAIEQNHDERGIIWPWPLAPFHVSIVSLVQDEDVMDVSDRLYGFLMDQGLSVLWDERKERPGVKFNDADLIGSPVQIIAGRQYRDKGQLEIKDRATGEVTLCTEEEAYSWLKTLIEERS